MILSFKLTMPRSGSWDGNWSGQGKLYLKTQTFLGKEKIEKAKKILEKKSYSYNWDDGWAAQVNVEEVTSQEATTLRRKSCGFCGYDWMIDAILKEGEIR